MFWKISLIIVPVIILVTFVFIIEAITKGMESLYLKAAIYFVLAILVSTAIYFALEYICRRVGIAGPLIGGLKSGLFGLLIGVLVSGLSAGLYFLVNRPETNLNIFLLDLPPRILANTYSAAVEEMSFRAGVVHALNSFWGGAAGLAGGSVPFGVLHLLGRIFGQPVGFMHVIGVSLAGLLLSALYLKYGFLSAMGCHLAWNSLCVQWVKVFNLPKGGVQMFEGAWTTSLVILLFFFGIYFFPFGD